MGRYYILLSSLRFKGHGHVRVSSGLKISLKISKILLNKELLIV